MRTTEFVGRMAALPTRFDIRVMDDTHTSHVAPYTGHPFTDRCDCCGYWQAHIIHVATNGWRYCDRCTDHHSFGTEGVV